MAKDLYAILGVSKDATDAEIKKAFRRKARELCGIRLAGAKFRL